MRRFLNIAETIVVASLIVLMWILSVIGWLK